MIKIILFSHCRELGSVEYKKYRKEEVRATEKKISKEKTIIYDQVDDSLSNIRQYVNGLHRDVKEDKIEVEKLDFMLKHLAVLMNTIIRCDRKVRCLCEGRLLSIETVQNLLQKILFILIWEQFVALIIKKKEEMGKWPDMKKKKEKDKIINIFISKENGLKERLTHVTGF